MKVTIYAQFYAINTFDGNNPNIYYSNPHIGAGILGGSYAGLERDEQGNINGFNPQKFALGFASGAGLSKGLQLSTKRLEKLASTNPKAKELLERIQGKHALSPNTTTAQNNDIMASKKLQQGQDNMLEIIMSKENKNTQTLRQEVEKILKPISMKPIVNKHDNRIAILNKDGRRKIQSSKAINKSVANGFSETQHFEVAKHLKELYENAKLREITPDKNTDKNIQMPRYEANFMLDGQHTQAKITLKETLKGMYKGNKIYTIELESIAKLPSEP